MRYPQFFCAFLKHGVVEKSADIFVYETSESEEHYGARLTHWYGDTNALTIDAGGLKALIKYYETHDTDLEGGGNE